MKTAQKVSSKLEQNLTVITFDEAIYSKGKEIQWRAPNEFDDVILRLRGFRIALIGVFLLFLGQRMLEAV